MERRPFVVQWLSTVPCTLFARTQCSKVFGRLWCDVGEEFHDDSACFMTVDGAVRCGTEGCQHTVQLDAVFDGLPASYKLDRAPRLCQVGEEARCRTTHMSKKTRGLAFDVDSAIFARMRVMRQSDGLEVNCVGSAQPLRRPRTTFAMPSPLTEEQRSELLKKLGVASPPTPADIRAELEAEWLRPSRGARKEMGEPHWAV